MKKNQTKEHPVLFSLMMGILLTLLVAVASAAATILELDETGIMFAQACAFLIMAAVVTVYMRKKDRTLVSFGFSKPVIPTIKLWLYYLPLVIIVLIQPVIGGLNFGLSGTQILLIIVFSLLVGYTEESIFRGIIRERLHAKGPVFYIVFSSLFFGILHMANALNGSNIIHILLQVLNALLLGVILALLIEITGYIIPLILFHFMFDALAQLTNTNIVEHELLVVSILNLIYLLYGAYLIYEFRNRNKSHA